MKVNTMQTPKTAEVVKRPTEGEWFYVDPAGINWELFQNERASWEEERARRTIVAARAEAEKNPEIYGNPFETLMPTIDWEGKKKVSELLERARQLGEGPLYWVGQALEWAQRLTNGETWHDICKVVDSDWYKIVIWKDGLPHRVGGSRGCSSLCPATGVCKGALSLDDKFEHAYVKVVRKAA